MEQERQGRPGDPRLLTAVCVQAAGLASSLPVLLFRRPEIAEHLNLLGTIVGEAALIGAVAVPAALGTARLRDRLPAGALLLLGGLIAAAGLALMASTAKVGTFVAGGVLLAVGSAPGLVVHRILLATDERPADRFRTLSWYWAAAGSGASLPLVLRVLGDLGFDTLLWTSAALVLVGTLLIGPHALVHDEDLEVEDTVARTDVPWARRAFRAAFAGGAVVVGGADAAQSLLSGQWQRSGAQTAAVLAAGTLAAALISGFGPWYHRLHRLLGGRRADAVGTNLLVAGLLVTLGGLSFTYIGLVACWLVAGGALGLAAAGLDASAFTALAPALRRTVAARQVLWAAAGALLASLVNALVIGAWSDQWKIAWVGLLLAGVGWSVRRYAPSARDAATEVAEAQATTVPRRVCETGSPVPPLLSVEQVSVAYETVQVLFDVDLRVDEGAVVALLGTNGAGKTTLLRAVSGLEPTIGGRIVYAGLDVTKTRPTWRVGMGLHQIVGGETVVGPLTVAENLRLFGHASADPNRGEALADAVAEVYELFPRLAERTRQRADTLSGGEKQMLSLAKSVIVPPRLLMIDEFSLGLAPAVVAELLPVVRRIAEGGAAVLLVEQSVNIALAVADYAYVMEKGEIGHSGTTEEFRAKPNLLQAAYLEGLAAALEADR